MVNTWLRKDHKPWDERVHPKYGWSRRPTTEENPLGLRDSARTKMVVDKRPKILFLGASFVEGRVAATKEAIPEYMDRHYPAVDVLHLAVGGYKFGQILLFFKDTHSKVRSPWILIGIHPENLRGISSNVFQFQLKPYFEISDQGELLLQGVPIARNQDDYFSRNPPEAVSYFYSFLARAIGDLFRAVGGEYDAEKERLQKELKMMRLILASFKKESQQHDLPLVFVLFHTPVHWIDWGEDSPEVAALKKGFAEFQLEYIDTKPIVNEYVARNRVPLSSFYISNGHHTPMGYTVVADGILDRLRQMGGRWAMQSP